MEGSSEQLDPNAVQNNSDEVLNPEIKEQTKINDESIKTESKLNNDKSNNDENKIPHSKVQNDNKEQREEQNKSANKEVTKETTLNNGIHEKPQPLNIKKDVGQNKLIAEPQNKPQVASNQAAELPNNLKQIKNNIVNAQTNGEALKNELEKKRSKDIKIKKTFKASDPTKIYVNKNDTIGENSPKRRGSRASVNSLQRTAQYSTISKEHNSRSQYASNPRMRNTFGNISFDFRKSDQSTVGKLYRNITGPGQYEQHHMTGGYVVDSRKVNQPSFSFGLKQDFFMKESLLLFQNNIKLIITREILQEQVHILQM